MYLFSTDFSAPAMLIQSVRDEQKLETADFRCTPAPPMLPLPPHWHLASLVGDTSPNNDLQYKSIHHWIMYPPPPEKFKVGIKAGVHQPELKCHLDLKLENFKSGELLAVSFWGEGGFQIG